MVYKVSIGNNISYLIMAIKSIGVLTILGIVFWLIVENYLADITCLPNEYAFMIILCPLLIIFLIYVYKTLPRESISIEEKFILTQKQGKLSYNDIKSYHIENEIVINTRVTNLVILMNDERYFNIGPSNNLSNKSHDQIIKLIDEFENNFEKITKAR